MIKHTEVMKLALEALEGALSDDKPYIEKSKQAISALREALAEQPAQHVLEVRVWRDKNHDQHAEFRGYDKLPDGEHVFYTSLQPAQQQEPVGEIGKIVMFGGDLKEVSWKNGKMPPVGSILYTSQPASKPWVGLTDDDREAAMDGMYNRWDIAEAIEAKLREKNNG